MKEWRRKHARIKCYTPLQSHIAVLLRFHDGKAGSEGWGTLLDISLGGIGIETRSEVKPGQTVYISFSISENFTFVNTRGTVRRATNANIYYQCGIEFESLVDRQHLQDALTYLLENEQSEASRENSNP